MKPEAFQVGLTYRVVHVRRGRFQLRVTEIWDKWIEGVVTGGRPICRERGRHIEIGETLVFAVALIDSAIPLEPAPSEGRTRPVFGKALTKNGGTNNGPASPKPAVKPTGQAPPGESPCRSG